MKPPASRYRPSARAMPSRLPEHEPSPGQTPRVVKEGGHVRHAGRRWYLGRAWDHETVGLTNSGHDGLTDVYFGPYLIAQFDHRAPDDGVRVRLLPSVAALPPPRSRTRSSRLQLSGMSPNTVNHVPELNSLWTVGVEGSSREGRGTASTAPTVQEQRSVARRDGRCHPTP